MIATASDAPTNLIVALPTACCRLDGLLTDVTAHVANNASTSPSGNASSNLVRKRICLPRFRHLVMVINGG